MTSVTFESRGKINIFLHVLGKRQDGFHELYTLFAPIGISDIVTVKKSSKFEITCDNPDIPTDERNIVSKVRNILDEFGINTGHAVDIQKRIPDGGGLGGGSSNAAAYLKAVLRLENIEIPMDEQIGIMTKVGSDTAFFLYDEPMIGEGRGEILKPYGKLPDAHVLLVNPAVHVSTAQVFTSGNLQLTDRAEVNRIPHITEFDEFGKVMFNGLESAVLPFYPEVAKAKEAVMRSGADFSLMSGSGATVFGLFRNLDRAKSALNDISDANPHWKCFLTVLNPLL